MTSKRLSFGILTVLVAAITGCSLEAPLQGTPCPSDTEAEAGGRLSYITLEDGSKCTRDQCLTEKDCCGLRDNLAKLAWQTFHYNRCAAGTPFFNCKQINEKEHFCGPVTVTLKCDPGMHPNYDDTYCENDTVDDCGGHGISCRKTGALTVYCVLDDGALKSKCVAIDCDDHYHLKDGECVADTATECGVAMEDCSQNVLSGKTVCSNGQCDSRCSGIEQICNGSCLIFENNHIDSCENNVMVCQEGYVNWDSVVTNGCETSLAAIHVKSYDAVNDRIECEDNYADCDGLHYAADTEVEGVVQVRANGCEVDLMKDLTHCGRCASKDDEGNDIPICGSSYVCIAGECVRNKCADEVDDDDNPIPDMCSVFVPELDADGEPVLDEDGNPVGKNEIQCFNLNGDDADRCGGCDYKCSENPITHATSNMCEGGVCQYVCEPGYENCSDSSTDVGINCISDEAMLQDSNNCGECGKVCGVNENGESTVCVGGECVVNSCTNSEETPCQEESGKVCHALNSTDATNCGACGYICANNPTATAVSNECKAGACQYTCKPEYTQCGTDVTADSIICVLSSSMQYDKNHCGNCDKVCNSDESCVAGECMRNTCTDGKTLCDLNECRNTTSDAENCGVCDYKCAEHPTSSAISNSCSGGKCQYQCDATKGYTQCGGGQTADSIICIHEDTFKTDRNNCGGCGDATTGEHICNSGEVCVNGSCVTNSCSDTTLTLCSTPTGNQCINVKSDLTDNCGSCGYTCANHSIGVATSNSCLNGVCQYSCPNTHENCGGNTADSVMCVSKESMQYDNYHCGNCTTVCGLNEFCVNGICEPNTCVGEDEGKTLCKLGDCRDTTSNAENCGACDYKCSEHPTSSAISNSCSGGKCQYQCNSSAGYTQCGGGQTADSIICIHEDTFKTDRNNCGGCGDVTTGAHICGSGEVCVNGSCVTNSCSDTTLTLCSTASGNQCINVKSNLATNCGSCGYKCEDHTIGVATSNSCLNGVCQYSCPNTHENCGGNTADSVMCLSKESMQYDNYHCGNCSTVCKSDESCVKGICEKNDCGDTTLCGIGDCRDTTSDADNCGACDYKCAEHPTASAISNSCSGSKCQYQCNTATGYTQCGGGQTADSIICIHEDTFKTDRNNCGGCGDVTTGDHICGSGEVCVNGSCVTNSCSDTTQTLCSTASGNQCINVKSNLADNCGSCGYTCADHLIGAATSNTCLNGVCQYTCPNTHENCGGSSADSVMCVSKESMQYDNYHCGSCSTVCKSDESCVKGICEKNDCGDTTLCGIGDCRDTTSDADNCGACDYKCAEHPTASAISNSCSGGKCQYQCDATKGYTQCGGGQTADSIICVHEDTFKTDRNNCGGCGDVTTGDHICGSGEVCVNGSCVTNSCPDTTLTLCSTPSGNQCINVKSNLADNCGSCGYTCANHSIGVATSNTCLNGVCQYSCPNTHENCGGNTERTVQCISYESMQSDNYHCGSCDKVCGSAESCIDGACVTIGCSDGNTLCTEITSGGDTTNVCRNLNGDPTNCGYCGYTCSSQTGWVSSGASCSRGDCIATSCSTGYCVSNGKCVNGRTSNTACGTSGTTCENCSSISNALTTYCDNGFCKVVLCKDNFHISSDRKSCDMDSPKSCGNSRTNCTLIPNAINPECINGTCVVNECDNGFHPSGNQCVEDSTTSCGGQNCGSPSVLNSLHASAAYCDGGTCKPRICLSDYSIASDGNSCKKDTNTDCGTYSTDCTRLWPNADQSTCSNGQCQKKCSSGYTQDSDGNCIPENSLVCPTGQTNCNGAGVCINLSNDSNNCGRCNHKCAAGTQCSSGRCVCSGTNQENCGTEDAPVCTSKTFTSTSHCGNCNNNCDSIKPAHTIVKDCSDKYCHFECDANYANADPDNGDTADKIQCVKIGSTSTCCYASDDGSCYDCTSVGKVCSEGTCVDSATSCSEPGTTLCNNGCYNVYTSNEHCGQCNNKCEGGTSCKEATCVCGEGKVKCEGMASCVGVDELDNNSTHCGACGNDCKSEELYPGWGDGSCVDGVCMAKKCDGRELCFDTSDGVQGLCVNGMNNPDKCGREGQICKECPGPTSGSGYGYCNNGKCAIACTNGTVLSDDKCISAYSGCDSGEIFCGYGCVPNNDTNCGACGHSCINDTSCSNGTCVCESGKEDCGNYNSPNCIDINNGDVNNCGACGYACSSHVPGWSSGSCLSSTCVPTSCKTDYCYADSTCYYGLTDNTHCGSGNDCIDCSTAFTDPHGNGYCDAGTCTLHCDPGYQLNGTNDKCISITTGCSEFGQTMCSDGCKDLSSDDNNCGSCGHTCGAGTTCQSGSCVCKTEGSTNCGSDADPKCVVTSTDTEHCGSCDNNCNDLTGWENPFCSDSQCHAAGCTEESGRCFDSTSKACVDGRNDVNHCGTAGTECKKCSTTDPHGYAVCNSGTCNTACIANYYWNGHECEQVATPLSCPDGQQDCNSDGVCENLNTVEYCGSCDINCTKTSGWKDGKCMDGVCNVTECDKAYVLDHNRCFATYVNMLEDSGGSHTSVLASKICGDFMDPTEISLTSSKNFAFDFDNAQNVNLDDEAQLILKKATPVSIEKGNKSGVIGLYRTVSIISNYDNLSDLSSVTCPTKKEVYEASSSINVDAGTCNNLPVICLMGPSEKIYKFIVITNGIDALIYWLPQN